MIGERIMDSNCHVRHGAHPPAFNFNHSGESLHVLMMYSNTARFSARARLFKEAEARFDKTPHVITYVVEVAFGDRPYHVTERGNPRHLQLRTLNELWHKENALNLLAQRLPRNWKYCAWIDSDVAFDSNPNGWAKETIELLQHYQIVQLFHQALDLDIHDNVMHVHRGFVSSWKAGLPFTRQYGGWHPGYGWAYTRDAWNGIGGLIDWGILGAGDDHMAKMLIGRDVGDTVPRGLHPNYSMLVENWRDNAVAATKLDIGFLNTTIKHYYHGAKAKRKYWERWEILKDKCPKTKQPREAFDPLRDIKRDWQGLWQLTDRKLWLRDGCREYMKSRDEDSNS